MPKEADEILRGALDKAQSVVNVLAALDTDHAEMMIVGHALLALGATKLDLSDEEVRNATASNVPMLRALMLGTEWSDEDTKTVRDYVDSAPQKGKIILP